MTRSAKFLIFITIMTTAAAAEIIFFAALHVPSEGGVTARSSFAKLTGSVMPSFYNEYRQSPVPEYPSAFDASLRSAVYGR